MQEGIPVAKEVGITEDEKTMGILVHVLGLFIGIISPIIFYYAKSDSEYVKAQAYTALNYHISYYIYVTLATLLCFILIGFLILPVVGIMYLVGMILSIVKATNLEIAEAPLSIKIFK